MAAELGMTTWSARRLVGDALETRHRLPRLWARVLAGEAPTWIVSKVAQAATVDTELAALVRRRPSSSVSPLLQALRTANDKGDGRAASGRPDGVPPERSGNTPDRASSGFQAFFTPFRPGSVPECPCRGGRFELDTHRLLPTVVLYLHLHAVDGYETPDRLREALHLRTPADVFPFAPNTGRKKQADHTIPYRPPRDGGPPGQTGLDNLGSMTGYHHRVKTHAGWTLKQPFPGVYLGRSPHGSIFLVDHTGTRRVRRPRSTASVRGTPLEQRFRALVDAA